MKRSASTSTFILASITVFVLVFSAPASLREAYEGGGYYCDPSPDGNSSGFHFPMGHPWHISPRRSTCVGPILVAAPYSLARALANRFARLGKAPEEKGG